MTKPYWTLGHYSRGSGMFTYEGKFETAQQACQLVGMNAYMWDEKTKKYVPFKEGSDLKRAECGVNANANIVNTYKVAFRIVPPKLTSQTEALFPKNRDRKTIGVGETITVFADMGVEWELTSNLVKIEQKTSKSIRFTALDKAGAVTVHAKSGEAKASMTIKIIQPSGIRYEQDYINGKPRIFHPKGQYLLGVGLRIILLPQTVNFQNLVIKEIDSASEDTGIFYEQGKIHCHIAGTKKSSEKCSGRGEETSITDGSFILNLANKFDVVGGGENDPNKIKILPEKSTSTFNIRAEWRLKHQTTWHPFPSLIKQTLVMTKSKIMTVSKGNFSLTMKPEVDYPDESVLQSKEN